MWDALIVACHHFNKNRLVKFSNFPGMEPVEVTDEMLAYAFPRLKEKIDNGWDKEHPGLTWVNCAFSVILPAYSIMCQEFKQAVEIKTRTCRTADLDGNKVPIVDLLEDGKTQLYKKRRDGGRDLTDDFYTYIEACEENGITPDRGILADLVFDMTRAPSNIDLPDYPDLVMLRKAASYRSYKTGESLQQARRYIREKISEGYVLKPLKCGYGFRLEKK